MGSVLTEGSKTRALARRRKSGQDPGNAQRFLGAGVQISGRTRKRRPVCRPRRTPEKQRQGGELVCTRGHRKPLQWKPALNLPNHRKSKAQRGTPRPRGVGCSRAPAGERPTCPSHLRGLPTPAQHPHSAREPLHKPAPLSSCASELFSFENNSVSMSGRNLGSRSCQARPHTGRACGGKGAWLHTRAPRAAGEPGCDSKQKHSRAAVGTPLTS